MINEIRNIALMVSDLSLKEMYVQQEFAMYLRGHFQHFCIVERFRLGRVNAV